MKRLILIPVALALMGVLAFTVVAAGPSDDEEIVEDENCMELMWIDKDGTEGVDVHCIDVDSLPDEAHSPGSDSTE